MLSAADRQNLITINNGWPGFLQSLHLSPASANQLGVNNYLRSGTGDEIVALAGLDSASLLAKISRIRPEADR